MPALYPTGFPNINVVGTSTPGSQTAGGVVLSTSNPLPPITTNTTVNVPSSPATIRVRQIVINVTGAPSAWNIKIQSVTTAFVIFSQTFNAPTTQPIVINLGDGVTMVGGVSIITSGTTPGTAYVALNF